MRSICGGSASVCYNIPHGKKSHEFIKNVASKQPTEAEVHVEEPERLSENVAFLNGFEIQNNEKMMPRM